MQLQPLQHGIPCETARSEESQNYSTVQPVVDEEVESSPNGSDSEASSSFQTSSTVNAEDVDSDLEELADHYYSPLAEILDYPRAWVALDATLPRNYLRRNGIFKEAAMV